MSEKIRVLVVDDDPLAYEMIEKVLEKLDYSIVGWAMDGEQAVEMAQSTQPDVILMDIQMPRVDGVEATRQILEQHPTPVIALTAHETPDLIREASAAGVGAYLVKPPKARDVERAVIVARSRFQDLTTLQRQADALEALQRASLRLTASLELQPVLNALLEQTLDLSQAYDAHIFLYDGEQLSFGAALWANGTRGKPFAPPRPDGLTYTVARGGKRVIIPQVNTHPLFQNWRWGGGIVGLPLKIGEQVLGVMNVAFEEPHAFDQNELRTLELLAAQAAIAIQNANLYQQVQWHADELEQRVAERTRELQKAHAQLQELDRLKSQFINDISHELRTPATNVRLYLQLLETGEPDKQKEYLSVIREQTGQLVNIVEDILRFSRLELDKADFTPVDLNQLVQEVVAAYRPRAEAAGLTLNFEPDVALSPVPAVPKQLTEVIVNLLDNAINYTPTGQVQVSTHLDRAEDRACLQVQDTGTGIAPEDMAHLFERFYRGRGVGSSNIPGTGLGMAVVQEIVNLHGGEIDVESEVGQGSTFRVWLPLSSGSS